MADGGALALLALLALSQGGKQKDTTPPTASGAPPSPDAGGGGLDAGALVKTGLGVLGAAGAGLKVAVGGSVAAGTAGTAGGSGGTAGAAAAPVAAEAGATAGSAAVGPVVAVCFPLFYLVMAIVGKFVNEAAERAKDFHSQVYWKLASAHALNQFEVEASQAFFAGTWSEVSVRDYRLDRYLQGSKLQIYGWRKSLMPLYQPDADRRVRQLRGLAYEYLEARHKVASNLIVNWLGNRAPQPFSWARTTQYESDYSTPGLGGLDFVPSALWGATLQPRVDAADVAPPLKQLIARDGLRQAPAPGQTDWQPPREGLTPEAPSEADAAKARLMGVVDALSVVRFDPKLYIPWDAAWYARDLMSRAGLGAAQGVTVGGAGMVYFDASFWGFGAALDVTALKEGRSAVREVKAA